MKDFLRNTLIGMLFASRDRRPHPSRKFRPTGESLSSRALLSQLIPLDDTDAADDQADVSADPPDSSSDGSGDGSSDSSNLLKSGAFDPPGISSLTGRAV
jgi:hypothetical protein